MIELFPTISNKIREEAENIWNISKHMNPVEAAKFLDIYTNIFNISHTEEETDFLRFYFNLQMEMMKE